MKIAFVITNGPTLTGGLERICLKFAQQWQTAGKSAKVVCRFSEGRHDLRGYFLDHETPRVFSHEGVEMESLAPSWFGKLLLKTVFKLSWRMATFSLARTLYELAMTGPLKRACRGAEMLHFFGTAQEMLGFAAHKAARQLGVPFVIEPAVHPGQWGDFKSDAILYQLADRVLTHTRYESAIVEQMGIAPGRLAVVTLGVDLRDDGNGNRFRELHGIKGPMILFLGRKTVAKGVERTLAAFSQVRQRYPEATLIIAGPAADKIAIPQNDPGILDLDDLTEIEKNDALAACDLLCGPSEGESFGMVYFEAWSYGKPVIALDLPSLHETVGESGGGILVDRGPGSLASAIQRLLSDPLLREQMGRAGAAKAARHSWEEAGRSYQQIVAPLLGGPKTAVRS